MVLDGGVFSTTAITSSFTAVLRISQVVYELKAVGEQTRDLLETTKYVNSSLEAVRELRRKKSDLLNREEKRWIDQQTQFTQKAVDGVAVLIDRARVDMQTKNENEEDFQTKHIKIHHRAKFVLEDGPKVQTNLMKVTMAMNGLNSAMVTLSSREGSEHHLKPSRSNVRRSTSPGKAPPPYAEGDFLNRRRTVDAGLTKRQVPLQSDFLTPENQEFSQTFGSQIVPHQPLQPRASMSSISPSIDFSFVPRGQYEENAIIDDITSPACLSTSSIRESIGSESYFDAHELDASGPLPSHAYELDASVHPPLHTSYSGPLPSHAYELDTSAHHPLYTSYSAPAVPTRAPTLPRKPVAYQGHRASIPSIASVSSIHDEFEQHLSCSRASSTTQSHSPYRPPVDAQKDLPMLPLQVTPSASTISLVSTLSDPSSNASKVGLPPVSRGRSWLVNRASQVAAGNVEPLSRNTSKNPERGL